MMKSVGTNSGSAFNSWNSSTNRQLIEPTEPIGRRSRGAAPGLATSSSEMGSPDELVRVECEWWWNALCKGFNHPLLD